MKLKKIFYDVSLACEDQQKMILWSDIGLLRSYKKLLCITSLVKQYFVIKYLWLVKIKEIFYDVTLACEDQQKMILWCDIGLWRSLCIRSLVKMNNEDKILCDMTLACEEKKVFCDVTLACEYLQQNDCVMWH